MFRENKSHLQTELFNTTTLMHSRTIAQLQKIRLKKVQPVQPLGKDDPIWKLAGAGDSGLKDVAAKHDHYLAEGEMAWQVATAATKPGL